LSSRFVDSNIFIYVLMNDPSYAEKSLHILGGFEEGKETGWTSTLALSQVFAHLKKRRQYRVIDKFYEYLAGSPISVTETSRADVEHAKQIKDEQKLQWNMWDDLVLASQMEKVRVTEIYSNDTDFDRLKGIRRIF
jgi:predicted nucleic acid-binding protein